ncbi:Putative peptidoglycan binding domain-containing protein [Clostridium sp. USBA 49]|uniref:peptidoglycan recognition protein family protein n=1 Tax=Clostridium sp. USBA 49 TaxID=1881060 RepID=UPI0009C473B4|nr:peptidoglycan-binding domain-containing protein [Clostridium sp. USBA 49]SKA89776.1 Putative peptidoglycan binding domain-containing protein [Clostridium sp. USBA 49]
MFEIITIDELLKRLDKYNHKELHVHHTWKPNHQDFNGFNGISLQEGIKNYHVNTLGWQDIGQHVTLLPDGTFITGRDFGKTPASISGKNTGAFACEILGNFDIGHDKLEGAQRDSIIKLARYFDNKGRYVRFHRENSPKTCPGTSIDKDDFMSEVRQKSVEQNLEVKIQSATKQKKTWEDYIIGDLAKELQNAINTIYKTKLKLDGYIGDLTLDTFSKIALKKGDKNALVKVVQKRLLQLGYKLPKYGADGSFGAETLNAIKEFQKVNALTVDGIVGKNTLNALFKK